MNDTVVVVTGANSGIGKVTATRLADTGMTVVLACRSEHRGQQALDEIAAKTGNERLHLVLLDLSSFDSVRTAAQRIACQFPAIDILVNNAGFLPGKREVSPIGVEVSFVVNYLSPFLFTNLLLDSLKRAPQARIVNVSSEVHRLVRIPWDDLAFEKRYGPYYAYSVGKLGNVMFTHELARRLSLGTVNKVTVNALHPGYVGSNFGSASHLHIRWGIRLVRPFLLNAESGSEGEVYLAMSSDVLGVSGGYFKGRRQSLPSKYSQRREECERLWRVSSELTGMWE